MKKILLISGGVILVVVLGIFSWILVSKDPEVPVGEVLRDFLPFGSGDDFVVPPGGGGFGEGEGGEDSSVGEGGAPEKILFRVTDVPVAGFVTLNRGASSTAVRYAERATGHIYEVNLENLERARLTNQTLPKIYEAHFRADGSAVLFRSLQNDSDVITNVSLAIAPPKAAATSSEDEFYTVSSTALRGELGSVAAGPTNTLFYVLDDVDSIVSSAFDGSSQKTLLSSQFTDWVLAPYGNTGLLVYTKAGGANTPGYAYTLGGSGGLTKVAGPVPDLTALISHDGKKLVLSQSYAGNIRSFIRNVEDDTSSEMSSPTFADKCVWSRERLAVVFCATPSNNIGSGEPSNWYLGRTSFQDKIWSFDTETELSELLAEPANIVGLDLDLVRPKLSPREDYLVFINKKDLSLWALKLAPAPEE